MSEEIEPDVYVLEPTSEITAYHVALILKAGGLAITSEQYNDLPEDVKAFLSPYVIG